MPENTSKRDPLVHMMGVMSDGPSDYITGMERDGQRQFVASEQMPTDAPIAELEALGFTFGPVDDRDPLFRPATLPDGWTRHGTDHAMHSDIRDDKGRKRVGIFYKAAFYDRRAHASIHPPHAPLSDAMWSDDEPTNVTLDDLLTADVARAYLDGEQERCEQFLRDVPSADRSERLARIALLRKLVDAADQ